MATEATGMSNGGVDDVFVGLHSAVGQLAVSSDDADEPEISVAEGASGVDDASGLRPDPQAASWPDPRRALRLVQRRLAHDARRRRADAAREFAAWWADLASVALADTAGGHSVQVVRAAVGDPSAKVSDEDLHQLPGTSFMDDQPVIYRVEPEYRRDQMWGTDWTDHRVPPLPSVATLSELLTRCGVPADQISAVCRSREAIADALNASDGVTVPEQAGSLSEIEHTERVTGLLVDYARLVTERLREIWSSTPEPDSSR